MAQTRGGSLVSAVLVAALVAAPAPVIASDPPAGLEQDNRAVVARLVDDTKIVVNGQMTVAELFNLLAQQGLFKYGLHEPYAKAPAKIQFWTTTISEALVWIGNECQYRYKVGDQGELDIQPATDPPEKRCWAGGEGLAKSRSPAS